MQPYPEPRGFYARPDVSLFTNVNANGVTVFYDSVCGVPVFQAPVNRTQAVWEAETAANGWPSFRDEEVGGIPPLARLCGPPVLSAAHCVACQSQLL